MGLFITLEGVEGCGKTTQAARLADLLQGRGRSVVALREPGGTDLGEKVRSLLLRPGRGSPVPWAELFLYEAARAQLVEEVIRPALASESVVICDRFVDSTLAYQCYGRGLDARTVECVNRVASAGIVPDVTVLIDCPPEVGLSRARSRNREAGAAEDRLEGEDLDFHRRVRDGYLALARSDTKRIRVVDGTGPQDVVFDEIRAIIDTLVL
ncbi:MAG TPA: dTMP kinase [Deltaproteobacteria bacterium]|nr:dTMP kinase [Deltaproteobacteria bacterium]